MKYITLSVPDKDYSFFINLMEKLDFVNIEKSANGQKRSRVPKNKLSVKPAKGLPETAKIVEYDMVVATNQIGSVPKGSIGAVVHIYPDNKAYEVEFVINDKNFVETVVPTKIEKK